MLSCYSIDLLTLLQVSDSTGLIDIDIFSEKPPSAHPSVSASGGQRPRLLRQRPGVATQPPRARLQHPHPARLRHAGQQASQRGSFFVGTYLVTYH